MAKMKDLALQLITISVKGVVEKLKTKLEFKIGGQRLGLWLSWSQSTYDIALRKPIRYQGNVGIDLTLSPILDTVYDGARHDTTNH